MADHAEREPDRAEWIAHTVRAMVDAADDQARNEAEDSLTYHLRRSLPSPAQEEPPGGLELPGDGDEVLVGFAPVAPPEPPDKRLVNPCSCGHEFVVHPFNRCIAKDCSCRQFRAAPEAPPEAPSSHLRSLVDAWRVRAEHAHGQYRNAVEDCVADLEVLLSDGEAARQQEGEQPRRALSADARRAIRDLLDATRNLDKARTAIHSTEILNAIAEHGVQEGEHPEPVAWAFRQGERSLAFYDEHDEALARFEAGDRPVFPLYSPPAPRQEASGDGLREAAANALQLLQDAEDSGALFGSWRAGIPTRIISDLRAALDAATPVAAPPGEGVKAGGREVVQPESGGFEYSAPPEEANAPGKAGPFYTPAEVSEALRQHTGPQPRRAIAAYHALATGQPVPPPHSSDPAWLDNGPESAALPPAMSEEVRELALAAKIAETYLLDPERDPERARLYAESLGEARAAVDSAPPSPPVDRPAPVEAEVRELMEALRGLLTEGPSPEPEPRPGKTGGCVTRFNHEGKRYSIWRRGYGRGNEFRYELSEDRPLAPPEPFTSDPLFQSLAGETYRLANWVGHLRKRETDLSRAGRRLLAALERKAGEQGGEVRP